MKVCELLDPRRRSGINLVFALSLGVALAACGGEKKVEYPSPTPSSQASQASRAAPTPQPAPGEPAAPPSEEVQALYRALAKVEDGFGAILERLSAGETIGDDELVELGEQLQAGARHCTETDGCNTVRFLEVMGSLVEEQNVAPRRPGLAAGGSEQRGRRDRRRSIARVRNISHGECAAGAR